MDRLDVIRRFAPFYNYHDEATLQKALAGPIRVLISTNILAEGLNLQDDPNLESLLQNLPWRVFSAKTATGGMPGVFACYRFPPGGRQGKSQELGELRWYFLPDGSDKVLTTLDEINRHIASEVATPRAAQSHPINAL